ncbi:Retinoid isomerohydrolase [Nymphaea thermarum]|nr:Retinoid isomerohydrolase [Nymphaea thermarum]
MVLQCCRATSHSMVIAIMRGALNGHRHQGGGKSAWGPGCFGRQQCPVGELPPTKCTVEGRLPSCLEGAYIRNGPNLQFIPIGAYHPFDGDGMLHAIRISGGHVTFCSRFVRTHRFNKEEEVGLPIYPNFFAVEGAARFAMVVVFAVRVLTGQINPMNGVGLAIQA